VNPEKQLLVNELLDIQKELSLMLDSFTVEQSCEWSATFRISQSIGSRVVKLLCSDTEVSS
jgi:hypothetical protein